MESLSIPKIMISDADLFLVNSTCTTKKEEKLYLLSLFGHKRLYTVLIYKGSIHGWKIKDFHTRCHNKSPTITLFKVKDGDCIGGFTNALWSSDNTFGSDKDAMLFNMSSRRHFPTLNQGKETYRSK
jgi:TLD